MNEAKQIANLDHHALTAIAQNRRPRVKRWYGVRGTGTTRRYKCYICGCTIDSESAKHRPTKHAIEAVEAHRDHHLDEWTNGEHDETHQ